MSQPTTSTKPTCSTTDCERPADTLVVSHPAGLACATRRCRPCAARLAFLYLNHGYAVHLAPTARPLHPHAPAARRRAAQRPRPAARLTRLPARAGTKD
jgi:hypothetical protein